MLWNDLTKIITVHTGKLHVVTSTEMLGISDWVAHHAGVEESSNSNTLLLACAQDSNCWYIGPGLRCKRGLIDCLRKPKEIPF
jgi:hypothetical protein